MIVNKTVFTITKINAKNLKINLFSKQYFSFQFLNTNNKIIETTNNKIEDIAIVVIEISL